MRPDTVSALHPVASTRPLCFGISSDTSPDCKRCPHRSDCLAWSTKWTERLSVSEAAAYAENALLNPGPGDETTFETYVRVYRKHYGCAPVSGGEDYSRCFVWVEMFCKENGVSIETWMTAQMHGMAKFLDKNERVRFLPIALVGDKAKYRYNIFIEMSSRRFQHAHASAFQSDTELHKLFTDGVEEHTSVVSMTLMDRMDGGATTLEDNADLFDVSDHWYAYHSKREVFKVMRIRSDLDSRYGSLTYSKLIKAIHLVSVRDALARWGHTIPNRIGFRDPLDVCALGALLKNLYPRKESSTLHVHPDLGEQVYG